MNPSPQIIALASAISYAAANIAALLENLGFLLFITALGLAPVATVSPLIATSPMWVVLAALLIFRDLEQVSLRTIIGTLLTVAGTIVITLRG